MRALILQLGFVCCAMGASTALGEVILDFNALPTSPTGGIVIGDSFTEDGFRLSTVYASPKIYLLAFQDGWQGGRGSSNGTTTVYTYDDSNQVTFQLNEIHDNPFRLLSIDLAEVFRPSERDAALSNVDSVLITGHRSDASQVSLTFNLDRFNDGPGGVADFETVHFSSEWTDLLHVNFVAKNLDDSGWVYVNFDNIRLEPTLVPEPSSLALLGGMALLGCVVVRRVRRRSA